MATIPSTVFVVVEDLSARQRLASLIRAAGWQPRIFGSVSACITSEAIASGCLLVDLAELNLDAFRREDRIGVAQIGLPVVLIADCADAPTIVRVMKAGAFDFLIGAFDEGLLIGTLRKAIEHSAVTLSRELEIRALRERHSSLSGRERQVMALVVRGLPNKQVGGNLGISEITVKAHRGRVMKKMKANSLAGLVTIAARLDTSSQPSF